MIKPQIPANESKRLNALAEYKILDTAAEPAYDELTNIAAMICNMPMATISLIDANRQFLKAKIGPLDIETPREIAFCAHAINAKSEMTIVYDSRADDRFKDNPLVLGNPGIIFYAGVPLVSPDGFALGTLCVMDHKVNNLSDQQKKALKALANQVINLLELKRVNHLLAESVVKIEEHAKILEDFAFVAAHDLKEPLRMISSFLGLLSSKYKDGLDDKAKKYIYFAVDGSKRLTKLIDELLIFARVSFDDQPLNNVDLNALMRELIALNSGLITAHKVKINIAYLPTIKTKETAIKTVFQNLISNALKYHAKQRTPIVEITAEERADHWLFGVKDNGIGIGEEYADDVFKPFTRINGKQQFPGTGLGLAICKKIIEKNGGDIWFKSEKNIGTVFYFTVIK